MNREEQGGRAAAAGKSRSRAEEVQEEQEGEEKGAAAEPTSQRLCRKPLCLRMLKSRRRGETNQ